jgi:soluble lytic murein transglycosylase-like protein
MNLKISGDNSTFVYENEFSKDSSGNAFESELLNLQTALYGAKKLEELKSRNASFDLNPFANAAKVPVNSVSAGTSVSVSADASSESEREKALDSIFTEASEKFGVDKALLLAIAKQESGFRTDAVSKSGAMGVMQLMPETAKGLGVTDALDAYQNIMAGANKISGLISKYNGDLSLALAAYNSGVGNVSKYGGIPPFQETQTYISKVLSNYEGYMNA